MPKIKVNGIHLFYELKGTGEPLVLIAGLCCDSTIWQGISDALSKHFQLILFDNRGVGRSDSPENPFTIENMADDTIALIDYLGLKKVHLLGHSMGGGIATIVAAKLGNKIGKLIIANASPKMNSVASLALKSNLHFHEDGVSIPRLVESIIPWIYSNEFLKISKNIEKLIELQLKNPHRQSVIGHKRQYEALIQYDADNWLKKITVPTLVIASDKDLLSPHHDGLMLSQKILGAKLFSFHEMGHSPLIEKPADFSKVVLSFLLS